MPTLTQIRINKKANQDYKVYKQLNYKNPYPINLVSKLMKTQNIKLIEELCEKNNVSDVKKQEIIKTIIKPNYYTPYIINSKSKERLQQII